MAPCLSETESLVAGWPIVFSSDKVVVIVVEVTDMGLNVRKRLQTEFSQLSLLVRTASWLVKVACKGHTES